MIVPVEIQNLRCEYLRDPCGIDSRHPRLSWQVESETRNTCQTEYRLQVAGSIEQLNNGSADLWDTNWIECSQCNQIPYSGQALSSVQQVFWKVAIRDNHGREAESPISTWTMGLLNPGDWKADWISANPEIIHRDDVAVPSGETDCPAPAYFRKSFSCNKELRRATLHASARGLFIFHLNGNRVSEDCFPPEWTDYNVRIHYRAYDVTGLVTAGDNALGAILGDGWFSGYVGWQETRGRYGLENSLVAQLDLEFSDGSSERIITDGSWLCDTGPIIHSDFMMGETYDARREQPGWNLPDFDGGHWLPAKPVDPPKAMLVAQQSEPVRITEELKPVFVHTLKDGGFIFDLGQNITGWMRIRVSESSGTKLTIRHGEKLNADGTLHTTNLRLAKSTDVYVCKGEEEETWQPHFTFHGFQYIEIRGLSGQPDPASLTGCVIHSATPPAGLFSCSHKGVNRLWLNSVWSQRDNFLSVPTDCPQRDERLGWMGDAQVFARTAMFNMDVAAFFSKWMTDVVDAQTPEGIFPDIAPRLPENEGNFVGLDGLCGAAAWADTGIIIPWNMWKVYGDTRIVERHWDSMVAWMDYLERTNPDWLRINELGNNYGDWLCIPSDTTFRTHSPMKNLLATAFWADDAAKLSELAGILDRPEEQGRFQDVFSKIRTAFQKEFLNPDGSLKVETQTAYLLALGMNLLPENMREAATKHLVDNIRNLDWHLSTGFCGIRYLNPILTDHGHADVAYRLLLNDDYPSWLYPVVHGATTIWERWNGWTEEDGFFDPHMNSFNHYSLGSVGEWLFSHVAGISVSPDKGGFSSFILKPYPSRKLDFAKASFRSHEGPISSEWRWEGDILHLDFTIPANTHARVFIPSDENTAIHDGEQELNKDALLKPIGREGCFSVYNFPSGSYRIKSTFTRDNP